MAEGEGIIKLVYLVLFAASAKGNLKLDWKCTDEICQAELCPDLAEECMDSTRALLVPSTKKCNCCSHCFVFLEEGEDCVTVTSQLQLPNVMCGPGLTCNEEKKCVKMEDNKKDVDFYKNYECKNGRCHCTVINESGDVEEIFGEWDEAKMNKNETQCECSIVAYKAMKLDFRVFPFNNFYQPSSRCLANGQFDPLQCIGELCGCVDKETGIPDENGFIFSVQALERNHPNCFDPSRHKFGEYFTRCEKRRNKIMQEVNEKFWSETNVIHLKKINCFPDGKEIAHY